MFQFTTTTVVNSLKDVTTSKDLFYWDAAKNTLHVKRVGSFVKDNVKAIYRAEGSDPQMAKLAFKLAPVGTPEEGDTLSLSLTMGLTQGNADARFANDEYYGRKNFYLEFPWKGTAAATVTNLEKIIKATEAFVYGSKLLDVEVAGDVVLLTAKTEWMRFKDLHVKDEKGKDWVDFSAIPSGAASAVTTTAPGHFKGQEGFGTYEWLTFNLRLPTNNRGNYFAMQNDELPVMGKKYNQYTIHMCVDRGPLGLNAVGDTVKSETVHVFYVAEDLDAQFKTQVANLGTATDVSPTV